MKKGVKLFINYRNNVDKNVYTIKYEDLFENNYQELRNILDSIGIKYTDDIFDNTQYTNVIVSGVTIENVKPQNTQHEEYRTWQINQQFISNNCASKIDLSKMQIIRIITNNFIRSVYPNIYSDIFCR